MMKGKLLFLDDHWPQERAHLANLPPDIQVIYEAIGSQGLYHLRQDPDIGAVLLDLKFDGQSKQGEEILREIKEKYPDLPVIILTSISDVELALRLVHKEKKAHYYFFKDRIDPDQLTKEVENAIGYYSLRADAVRKTDRGLIVGSSPVLQEVLRLAARASRTESTVLIMGETGTGKELIARSIHLNGPRRERPFVAVNCGAIPEQLMESELFGHVKGAFSDAVRDRRGFFEVADGGTIFLDEVGELSLDQQVKLLRVLDSGEIQKVGADRPKRVDVRVIAATNRDLSQAAQGKRFREDLYYRLHVFPIVVPPLRERKEDIPALVQYVLANRLSSSKEVSGGALGLLQEYHWPGNIRELVNVMERVVLTASSEVLTREDFAALLSPTKTSAGDVIGMWVARVYSGQASWADLRREFKGTGETLRNILEGIIRQWILEHGERPSGNELASLLGTNRNNVMQIMNTLGLKFKDYNSE